MLRLAVIDDNKRHADFMAAAINKLPTCKAVAVLPSGVHFVKYCYQEKILPHIAVTDVQMKGLDGVALTDYITTYFPTIKVIGTSTFAEVDVVTDLFSCGAKAFVGKYMPVLNRDGSVEHEGNSTMLEKAIDKVTKDDYYIDELVLNDIDFANFKFDPAAFVAQRQYEKKQGFNNVLTKREQLIASLYACSDMTIEDIANTLHSSHKTVQTHVTSVYKKLEVDNRQKFTLHCLANGLLKIARLGRR